MSDNIIKFPMPDNVDISYMVKNEDQIVGVSGKNFDMEILTDGSGFLFNDQLIKNEELIALVMVSGLWQDVCTNELTYIGKLQTMLLRIINDAVLSELEEEAGWDVLINDARELLKSRTDVRHGKDG